jgi:hypothetical protein
MPEAKLTREVEVPRPRSSGAAVVAVASLAMFTAVGASAFVVRVRMVREHYGSRRMDTQVVRGDAARLDEWRPAFAVYPPANTPAEMREFLSYYGELEPTSPEAVGLNSYRNRVAITFRRDQMGEIALDVELGRCGEANRKLGELRVLVPEADLPELIGNCQATRYIPVTLWK